MVLDRSLLSYHVPKQTKIHSFVRRGGRCGETWPDLAPIRRAGGSETFWLAGWLAVAFCFGGSAHEIFCWPFPTPDRRFKKGPGASFFAWPFPIDDVTD
jgi:hypothetical protein